MALRQPRLASGAGQDAPNRSNAASGASHQHQHRCLASQSSHNWGPLRPSDASATQEVATATNASLSSTWVSRAARKAMFSQTPEQAEPMQAHVVGAIPAWLDGDLVTNGAGSFKGMVHTFDGLAMISKVSIRQEQVKGMQRHLQTKQRRHQEQTGRLRWREFVAELPSRGPLDKALQVLDNLVALASGADATTDNGSVNVVPLPDGTIMAMSEPATSIYRVSHEQLGTLEQIRFKDGVPGQVLTAHPKLVPGGSGQRVVNFGHRIPFGGRHLFMQDLDTLQRMEIAYFPDVNPARPAWVHDLGATPNYAIIVEPPLLFNMPCLVLGGSSQVLFMDWVPEQKTRIHVAKLDGSWQRTFVTDAFFTFHHVNAFEDPNQPNQLHVDMSVYDGPQVLNDLSLASMSAYPGQNISPSYFKRLTIPLDVPDGTHIAPPWPVIPGDALQAYGQFFEFPTINPAFRAQLYRYAYSLSVCRPSNMGNALAKFDLQTGQTWLWHEPGTAPGEPVFVPAPNPQSEDDGAVLCNIMGADGKSFLLVLDGRTFAELGRAYLPFGMGYRLHGTFIPSA